MKRSGICTAAALVLLSLLVLPGCGGSEASVAGMYELDKEATKSAAETKLEAEAAKENEDGMAEFVLGVIQTMTMTMTLNEDKTASMMVTAMGETDNATGTWELNGKSIVITVGAEGEEPEPATGTVNGDTITLAPPNDGDTMPFDLVFKKKAG